MMPMILIFFMLGQGSELSFPEYLTVVEYPGSINLPKLRLEGKKRQRNKIRTIWLYLISLAILCIYAGFVRGLSKEKTWSGVISVIAIFFLDLCIYLSLGAGWKISPFRLCILTVSARIALVFPGENFWFLGHCLVYIIFGLVSATVVVDQKWKAQNKSKSAQERDSMIETLKDFVDANHIQIGMNWKQRLYGYARSYLFVFFLGTLIFLLDVLGVGLVGTMPEVILVQDPHPQWLYGIASLCFTFILPCLFAWFRIFQRSNLVLEKTNLVAFTLAHVLSILSGVVLWQLANSRVMFVLSLFFVPVFTSGAAAVLHWAAADYVWNKKSVFWLTIYLLLLVAGGVLTSVFGDPAFIGATVAVGLAAFTFTTLPLIQWFARFRVNWFIYFSAVMTIGLLVFYGTYVRHLLYRDFEKVDTNRGLTTGLLLFIMLYLFIASLTKWRDDHWKPSRTVFLGLMSSLLMLLALGVVTAIIYSFLYGIAISAIAAVCLLLVYLTNIYISHNFYLPKKFRYFFLGLVLVFAGFGVAIGVSGNGHGFVGFTISWACFFATVLALAVHRLTERQYRRSYFSPRVFPSFTWDAEANDIQSANQPILLAYSAIVIVLIWGILAAIFAFPAWIGLSIASLSLVLLFVGTVQLLNNNPLVFSELQNYVTREVLDGCHSTAKSMQIGKKDSISSNIAQSSGMSSSPSTTFWGRSLRNTDTIDTETFLYPDGGLYRFLQQERKELFIYLASGKPYNLGPNLLSTAETWTRLLFVEEALGTAFTELNRYYAHFEILAIFRAKDELEFENNSLATFIREHNIAQATDASKWTQSERQHYQRLHADYLVQKHRTTLEIAHKRIVAEQAEQKRQDRFLESLAELTATQEHIDLAVIQAECRQNKIKFVDTKFPPTMASLCYDPTDLDAGAEKVATWLRPEEIAPDNKPVLFQELLNASNIRQGNVGDCWLLSAMTVMSRRPDLLTNMFEPRTYSPDGIYVVTLYKNSQKIQVVIDDYLPCGHDNKLVYARSVNECEMWVSLLEKAYAKLHGCFQALNGGLVHLALVDLTGGASDELPLDNIRAKQDIASGAMWKKLLEYHQAGYLMGAGSQTGSDTQTNEQGIVLGHAYAILDIVEEDGHQLLRLKNPWGKEEWNGDWCDGSEMWTRRMSVKLSYKPMQIHGLFLDFFQRLCAKLSQRLHLSTV
eukprot:TRINITY_DN1522_c1_g1_i1.p1 TRINITY_DN1522_c1_g1~~TRINITY_DN1522_c1_g1_i1.p1  ORF type:complete len:1361 (+),score=365.30 TRINITY_DN1522_c1_g1_i1:535-4083(+)